MKLIIISTTPPPVGGISKWTVRMLQTKLDHDWEIVLVDDKPIDRESFGDNIKINWLNEVKRAKRIWGDLYHELSNREVKVVHACPIATLPSLISAYIECKITHIRRKKFIAHFRCTVPNMINNKMQKVILKHLCKSCDYIMVLNKQTELYIKKLTTKTVEIVPNFADCTNINPYRKINEKIKTAVYAGGVTEEKGCLDIIKIAKAYPEIHFNLIGKAEKRVIESAEGISNIELRGVLSSEEVKVELFKADVFLFLSKYPGEGFSNALVEAMASGLPCIVSDWAANEDMIENKGGCVVPINSPDEAVKAMKMIFPATTRMAMSEWNINKVKTSYSEKRITSKYVEIYDKLSK